MLKDRGLRGVKSIHGHFTSTRRVADGTEVAEGFSGGDLRATAREKACTPAAEIFRG
jgi:hypothetical protein